MLRTLGSLTLTDASFKRQKPMLLLAYLAFEGAKERRYVAELFWPKAAHALSSLSVALSQLRQVSAVLVQADDVRVSTQLECDAPLFLDLLDAGQLEQALGLYRGPFLEGVNLTLGEELEEWLYQTREYLAARVQEALQLAEQNIYELTNARQLAEEAYTLPGIELNPDLFQRFYSLFVQTSSPKTKALKTLADTYNITLSVPEQPLDIELDHQGNNLAAPTTPLVGRDPEFLDISQLLTRADCRLLTILGADGMGKTKLSLHVGHDFITRHHFPDGVGGFSRQAAGEVAQATLGMLAKLVGKSLLNVDGQGRYTRHVLLYQYMQEKLQAHTDKETVAERHSQYFLTWLVSSSANQLKDFDDELENIRTAWHYAIRTRATDQLINLSWSLSRQFDSRSRQLEGAQFFSKSIHLLAEAPNDPLLGRIFRKLT